MSGGSYGSGGGASSGQAIFTDDVRYVHLVRLPYCGLISLVLDSLQIFFDHLKRLVSLEDPKCAMGH
jgi:hypothetical protein